MASASIAATSSISHRPLRAAPALPTARSRKVIPSRRISHVVVRAEKDPLQSGATDSTKKMTKESTGPGPLGSQQPERWSDADKAGLNLSDSVKQFEGAKLGGLKELAKDIPKAVDALNPLGSPGEVPRPGHSQSTDILTYEGLLERVNGRAAMLGFVIAIATEMATGRGIVDQINNIPLARYGFLLISAFTILSSLVPASLGIGDARTEARAPTFFKPGREIVNGRTAMLGFVAMLATEAITGQTTVGFWLQ